jgi:hypothetical protein
MSRTSTPEQILEDIVFALQKDAVECKWFLSSEKLAELLALSKEDFFRKLYNFKTSKPDRDTRLGFSEIDGDYLCEFLQYCLQLQNVSDRFARAGLYFDERSLYELREAFKAIIRESLDRHDLDKDTMLLLAAASQNFEDAVDSYISDKFETDFFVERSVFDFMSLRKIPFESGAEIFLRDYLRALIPTKILNLRDITREFRDRSFYDLFGRHRDEPKKKPKQRKSFDRELYELALYFGLEDGFTLDELKKKFKELLKKYHPDVNKRGEEKTKEILAKYNRLVILINQSQTGRVRSY